MENGVQWNERFNIGVDAIDNAHQRLFSIVNRLVKLSADEHNSEWACREGIKYFKSYAIKHFEAEEDYMKRIKYGGYGMHKRLHDNLKNKTLPALEREMEESGYSAESVKHFLGICIGWLTGHIMIEDRAITNKVTNKWVYGQKDEVLAGLEHAIPRIMQEVFGLRAQVVSEHYGGEEFGKAICCRLIYYSSNSKKYQIFLGVEERLALCTVGQMLGMQFAKADKMVSDAIRQLSQQLVKYVGAFFRSEETFQFEKDNLLTREQFDREFETRCPDYSLLFDTGIGYFVFCIRESNMGNK